MAEMEGFEPPGGLTRQLISSQPRYDHFDTPPDAHIIYHGAVKVSTKEKIEKINIILL